VPLSTVIAHFRPPPSSGSPSGEPDGAGFEKSRP
jgi:hypothetical protein